MDHIDGMIAFRAPVKPGGRAWRGPGTNSRWIIRRGKCVAGEPTAAVGD